MKMDNLSMCRICLVQNVRLYAVTNKNLQQIYEKLTNFPFETEDSRPKITCLFCYTKLKQCCQLLRKCLDAEELFDQMACDDYEPDIPLVYPGQLEYFGGLTRTPIEHVSILCDWQVDSCADDDELSVEDDSCDRTRSVDIKENHDDVIEVELQKVWDHDYIEQKEYLSIGPHVAKKPTIDVRRTNLEDTTTAQQKKTEGSETAGSEVTQNRTSKPVFKFRELIQINKLRKHTGEKPFKCDICRCSFSFKRRLIEHTRFHTGEKPYKCDICQHNFRVKSTLDTHIRVHTGEKPYKCKLCQRSFRQLTHLKHHVLTHTSEKPYICDICQRGFTTKANFQTHYRVHTGEKPHKCDVCQRSFKTSWILKHHLIAHTSDQTSLTNFTNVCDICQRVFITKSKLRTHYRVHTGEKPYVCHICQRGFAMKYSLQTHYRVHTGEKPYKCDVCQRSFSNKSAIINHSITHTGEKPYKCEICQRSFNRKANLENHMLIHSDEKKYQCEICAKCFRQSSTLNSHLKVHNKEKQ